MDHGRGLTGRPQAAPGAQRPLALKTESSTTPAREACARSPEWLALRLEDGTLLSLPCRRRDCPHCAVQAARVETRALLLDAREDCPTVAMLLTTVDPATTAEDFRRGMQYVFRALRRRWPVRYFARIEWTTGEAPTSGGERRQHAHVLLKDLPPEAAAEAEEIARRQWHLRTGAHLVTVEPLRSPGAVIDYVGLHFHKLKQGPPEAWRGMRTRHSTGRLPYFREEPVWRRRDQARAELRTESVAWRLQQAHPELDREAATVAARLELELERTELVHLVDVLEAETGELQRVVAVEDRRPAEVLRDAAAATAHAVAAAPAPSAAVEPSGPAPTLAPAPASGLRPGVFPLLPRALAPPGAARPGAVKGLRPDPSGVDGTRPAR